MEFNAFDSHYMPPAPATPQASAEPAKPEPIAETSMSSAAGAVGTLAAEKMALGEAHEQPGQQEHTAQASVDEFSQEPLTSPSSEVVQPLNAPSLDAATEPVAQIVAEGTSDGLSGSLDDDDLDQAFGFMTAASQPHDDLTRQHSESAHNQIGDAADSAMCAERGVAFGGAMGGGGVGETLSHSLQSSCTDINLSDVSSATQVGLSDASSFTAVSTSDFTDVDAVSSSSNGHMTDMSSTSKSLGGSTDLASSNEQLVGAAVPSSEVLVSDPAESADNSSNTADCGGSPSADSLAR